MQGLLNFQQQPYGMLSQNGYAQPPGSGGFGASFVDWFKNNPSTIFSLAAGIGSAPTLGMGLIEAAKYMPEARSADQQLQDRQTALAEQQARRAATMKFLKARQAANAGEAIPPDTMELFAAYPDLAEKYVGDLIAPQPLESTDDILEWQFAQKNPGFAEWMKRDKDSDLSNLGTLIEERNAIFAANPNDPNLTLYDQRIGREAAGSGMRVHVGENGEVTFEQGALKPLTESQSKDTVFVTRAQGALPLINQFGPALTSLPEAAASGVPLVGNYLLSPEYQQAAQAGKEFLQAILRKDTGAAITKEETAEYGSVYLPQPGDSPEVLAQKQLSRERAVRAIAAGLPPSAILALEKAGIDPSTIQGPAPVGAPALSPPPALDGAPDDVDSLIELYAP